MNDPAQTLDVSSPAPTTDLATLSESEEERLDRRINSIPQTLDFDTTAKFANEIMFAKQKMTESELKVWLLMLAALSRNQSINEREVFSFNMRELAKRLGFYSSRQAWKSKMRTLFDSMITQSVRIMKRDSKDEDLQHWVRIPLYSCLEYDGESEKAFFDINSHIIPYLKNITEHFTEFEIDEMLSISGLSSLKVYILVHELISEGKKSISIDLFKSRLGMSQMYEDFKFLVSKVLKPAEREIRQKTHLHDFHFSHDGKGRHAATTIYFTFGPDAIEHVHQKKELKELVTMTDKIELLTPEQRQYYKILMEEGVKPDKKAYEIVICYPIDVIRSNYSYYCDKKAHRKPNDAELRAGYLINCIQKDYAKKDRDRLARKARASERQETLEEAYHLKTKIELADWDFRNKAGAFLKNAPVESIMQLVDRFLADIYATAEELGFNFSKDRAFEILTTGGRKLTTREMNAIREVFAQQIKFHRIEPNEYMDDTEENEFKKMYREMRKRMEKKAQSEKA